MITFFISSLGVLIGHKIGSKINLKVELIGGIFLIILGIKIFLTHI